MPSRRRSEFRFRGVPPGYKLKSDPKPNIKGVSYGFEPKQGGRPPHMRGSEAKPMVLGCPKDNLPSVEGKPAFHAQGAVPDRRSATKGHKM
jgi:hypothetical protein